MSVSLLTGGVVVPMAGDRTVIGDGAVLADGDTILAVGPSADVAMHPLAVGADVVDLRDHIVMPGMHNCHMHSGLLRGTAENLPLLAWLATFVDPMHRALTPEIAEAASRLCYAEAVLGGTTSVMDMWRHLDRAAVVARSLGLRATLVPYVADGEGLDYFETLDTNRELIESIGVSGRVRAWVGLEHLLYCTPAVYTMARSLADEFGTDIHTHSSEQQLEIDVVVQQFGRRPIHELHARGLLDHGRCVIAHCVWLDDAELDLLASTGTRVAHCPCSNMKLASGIARVPDMWARGITVGLGSDGEKENNNLDLLEEMKFASLLQKVSLLDAGAGDPWAVLAMATLEGARCLGLDRVAGSLVPGKRADIVAIDARRLHLTPMQVGRDQNVVEHVVFSAQAGDVDAVWIDGAQVVGSGRLLTDDIGSIRHDAQEAAMELFERRRRLVPAHASAVNA